MRINPREFHHPECCIFLIVIFNHSFRTTGLQYPRTHRHGISPSSFLASFPPASESDDLRGPAATLEHALKCLLQLLKPPRQSVRTQSKLQILSSGLLLSQKLGLVLIAVTRKGPLMDSHRSGRVCRVPLYHKNFSLF